MMYWPERLLFGAALALVLLASEGMLSAATAAEDSYSELSIEEIEEAIKTTQAELDQLPLRLIRESGGTLGLRINGKDNKPEKSWVEVDLGERRKFDCIMLVPVVFIDENQASSTFAFPRNFQIRSYSSAEDEIGQLLFDSATAPLTPFPSKSPVIIDCPGAAAQRVRFIPMELHQVFDEAGYIYCLSELLVFDGNHNLALRKPVSTRHWTRHNPTWHKQYLTDGYLPYTVPSTRGESSINGSRMFVPARTNSPATITIDLGSEQQIDEVRLYPLHPDRNFAVFHKAAMGFPRRFDIEVSKDAGFSSPSTIFQAGSAGFLSPGHRLVCFSANGTRGRYVRISASSLPQHPQRKGSIFAFAEIEVLAKGEVVSRGMDVDFSHDIDIKHFPPSMLVDGMSSNGTILPLRSWLTGLAKRNELEVQLAALNTVLQDRYLRQTRIAQGLRWGIGIVLFITLAVYLWQRIVRQQQILRLREDLAADLHDEIGGNFSGIALLSDELANEEDMPEDHIPQLTNIANVARSSAVNARSLVRFLESRYVTGKLLEEMQTTAKILLTQHRYQFDVEGYRHVSKLEPKDKWHLLLFFKEALNNIVKHADATDVDINLHFNAQKMTLSIVDNGKGLDDSKTRPPAHLTTRAQKLNARLQFSTPSDGGTAILLEKQL
ncbi:MAG: ATP-binding protein [Akkermansiaceae bacterium]|nr:ATP-binding protein [Akkermansiaceae bacterium]